jgi:hypothetical protein
MNFSRSSIWLHSCQGILLSSQKAQLQRPLGFFQQRANTRPGRLGEIRRTAQKTMASFESARDPDDPIG